MTTLTDIQRLVLDAARVRPDHSLLPLPERLKGGAARKVVDALIAKGLAEEREAGPDAPSWREGEGEDGRRMALVATQVGLETLGAATGPDRATAAHAPDDGSTAASELLSRGDSAPAGHAATAPGQPRMREGTKQAQLVAMLRAEGGATIDEIAAATGWKSHTVRGAIAGALKKRLGLEVTSEKVENRGRAYRIAG